MKGTVVKFMFNRFYADSMFMDNPIDWDDMI